MRLRELKVRPITANEFAPFGEIIDRDPARQIDINAGRFERFQALATVDTDEQGGCVNVSIFQCRVAVKLPYTFDMVERHPIGSQAFMPLSDFSFVVVVAPPGDSVEAVQLRAFRIDGRRGINMHRGVWHLPMLGQEIGQEFLVVDRGGGDNCDEYHLPTQTVLVGE